MPVAHKFQQRASIHPPTMMAHRPRGHHLCLLALVSLALLATGARFCAADAGPEDSTSRSRLKTAAGLQQQQSEVTASAPGASGAGSSKHWYPHWPGSSTPPGPQVPSSPAGPAAGPTTPWAHTEPAGGSPSWPPYDASSPSHSHGRRHKYRRPRHSHQYPGGNRQARNGHRHRRHHHRRRPIQ